MLSLLAFAAEHEEERAQLIMAPWAFPLIAALIFVVLAFVVWSYRDVANRHSDKVPHGGGDSHGAGGHGGGH